MDEPLFSPDEIPVDETIDYVASVHERTIPFVQLSALAESPLTAVAATGTDDRHSGH